MVWEDSVGWVRGGVAVRITLRWVFGGEIVGVVVGCIHCRYPVYGKGNRGITWIPTGADRTGRILGK